MSQNGWNGVSLPEMLRPPIDLPRRRDARPMPEHDREEVMACRRALGPLPRRPADGFELDPELEAGALADLEWWGCDPFEED